MSLSRFIHSLTSVSLGSSALKSLKDNDAKSHLIYQPIHVNQIRIVILAPGRWKDQLRCTLQTVSVDAEVEYEALSYTWGDENITKTILLQGFDFQVTTNLDAALRHLRLQDKERKIWIDALCINQSDTADKTIQIRQMHLIYVHTAHLVVWVGEAEDDSDIALQTCEEIGQELEGIDYINANLTKVPFMNAIVAEGKKLDPRPWLAIDRLFQRSYFERLWVVQEICLPKRQISLVCGSRSIPWEIIAKVHSALISYRWPTTQMLDLWQAGYSFGQGGGTLGSIRQLWRTPGLENTNYHKLSNNLWMNRNRKCKEPNDKVFAVLGICEDVQERDIEIDCSHSAAHIYSKVASLIIQRDRSLRLLSACQTYGRRLDLPSWAPDWSLDHQYRPLRSITSWQGEQWENLDSGIHVFHASGSTYAQVEIRNLQVMVVQGLQSGEVSVLGSEIDYNPDAVEKDLDKEAAAQAKQDAALKSWWLLARQHSPDVNGEGEKRIDMFWRTIIADVNNRLDKARHEVEGQHFRFWMRSLDPMAFQQEDLTTNSTMDDAVSFRASYLQAVHNRRFFITAEDSMGIGPRDMRIGDVICILFGSQVPLVLRKVGERYQLIGECYYHGKMEGEELKSLESGTAVQREFSII